MEPSRFIKFEGKDTPYFIQSMDGVDRVFRMKPVRVGTGDQKRNARWEVMVHPMGGIVELPVNDADNGRSFISRMENIVDGGGERNLYLAKNFRMASKASDVTDAMAASKANAERNAEIRRLRANPSAQTAATGNAIAIGLAAGMKDTLKELMAQRDGKRGGA